MTLPRPSPWRAGLRRGLLGAVAAGALAGGGCTTLAPLNQPPANVAVATGFPWQSMVYAARTDTGVLVVDLGWRGAEGALDRALRRIGAGAGDVTDVFLTHSHRDHIGGWRAVRHARFHMGADEVAHFEGQAGHADLPSRAARTLLGSAGPEAGEVDVRPFGRDTAYAFGGDTLRAYRVPGHTPGSAAYLFRGVLFTGDAIARSYLTGYQPAYRIFSDDPALNRASLRSLFERVAPHEVEWVCTAHSRCVRPDERFLRKVLR